MQTEIQGKHRQHGKIHTAGSLFNPLMLSEQLKAVKEVRREREGTTDRYFNGAQICTNYVKRSDRP